VTTGTAPPGTSPGASPGAGARAADLARAGFAGLMVGVIAVVFAVSFTAIIYAGDLAADLSRGIGLTLAGASLMALVGAACMSYRGTIVQPQDVTAVIVALAAASIAASWTGSRDGLFATVALLVAATTALTGAVAWTAGRVRFGFVARFVPYPVLGGFLAATGYLLTIGALGMATGRSLDLWTVLPVLAAAPPERWLPWLVFGIALAAISRRYRHGLVLPGAILLAGIAFYAALWASGRDLAEAAAAGLLLGPFEGASFLDGLSPALIAEARPGIVAAELPTMLVAAGMAVIGALLYASALEVATGTEIDPDRDLRGVGLANLAGACGGGMVGYHLLSQTLFARALGITGVASGLAVAAFTAATLVFGAGLLSALPLGLFAGVIAFLGVDLLYTWLWEERHRLPRIDYAIVLLIVAVAATVGFLEAIAIGTATAALLFIVAYAGIDTIRLRTTAATLRSRVERPGSELRVLAERGHAAAIYQLSGYLFFGTASRLLAELQSLLAAAETRPRFIVLDFRRVSGIDASAAFALAKLGRSCEAAGVEVILAGVGQAHRGTLLAGTGQQGGLVLDADLNEALRGIEERLLAEDDSGGRADRDGTFLDELARLHPDFPPERFFARITVPAGHDVIEQGTPADSMWVLLSGQLQAVARAGDGPWRAIATIRAGSLVGEIGLYGGGTRTARVRAETDCTLLHVTAEHLAAIARAHPAVANDFHRLVAAHLARRLARTNDLLRDMEA
jgi:SulP family sulfate permease